MQRWKLLLITGEMLDVSNAKDPEQIRTDSGQLQKDFLGADSEI